MNMWEKYLSVLEVQNQVNWGIFTLCLLILFLCSQKRLLSKYRPFVVGLSFVGIFYSVGNLLLGGIWAWVLFAILVGLGFSMRTLLYDIVAMFYLNLEGSLTRQSWVEGSNFQGCVEQLSWRCVTLKNSSGKETRIPNHHFLILPWSIMQPGSYRKSLSFWITEEVSLSKLEARIAAWLATAPWIGGFHGLHRDHSNPLLIVIDISLLHFEDEARVRKALRILIEDDYDPKKNLQ